MKQVIKAIRDSVRDIFICRGNRKKLENKDFTLFSSDCTGGIVYHELKQEFSSPTINMYFDAGDFIKFIKNPKYYLDLCMIELPEDTRNEGYPVALLGDIKLHLVHYKTVAEAQEKWNRRKKRINWNNVFYIMNDRNYCTYEVMKEYDEFLNQGKYNGVIFTCEKYLELKHSYCITGSKKEPYVPIMTSYTSLFHRRMDQFDWIKWLNNQTKIG